MSKSNFASSKSIIQDKALEDGYHAMSRKELSRLRKIAEATVNDSPKESLIISKSNGVWQYYRYCSDRPGKKLYIRKDSMEYVRKLANREYCELLIKEIDRRLKAKREPDINDMKKLHDIYEQLSPARRQLVTPLLTSDAEYRESWLASHPDCANTYEIAAGYETEHGETVRSKSEKIIADKLYNMGIPYSYECKLRLGDSTMYPDFTILNTFTRRTWYWEHFGLMDDEIYRDNMSHKLNVYENGGIFSGDGLIITTEGARTPLDTRLIGVKIRKYLMQ